MNKLDIAQTIAQALDSDPVGFLSHLPLFDLKVLDFVLEVGPDKPSLCPESPIILPSLRYSIIGRHPMMRLLGFDMPGYFSSTFPRDR